MCFSRQRFSKATCAADRIMWGTGAMIWGTEELTRWDTQGELIGHNEAGERIALPIEQFTVGVRAQGVEETWVRDIAALGGTLVSAMGDVSGFVHTDLDRAGPMIRSGWAGSSLDYAQSNPDVIVGSGEVNADVDAHVIVFSDRGKTWKSAARLAGVPAAAPASSRSAPTQPHSCGPPATPTSPRSTAPTWARPGTRSRAFGQGPGSGPTVSTRRSCTPSPAARSTAAPTLARRSPTPERPACPPKASTTSESSQAARATSGSPGAATKRRSQPACGAPRTAA
ncbi:hypothetical protein [Nonomuraea helvata]|uniref:Exo-alpha-sialidase n=1 Tax=Nonomuraea helvata TaxID=37484 RepID=A0ABV5S8G8_9ACTN